MPMVRPSFASARVVAAHNRGRPRPDLHVELAAGAMCAMTCSGLMIFDVMRRFRYRPQDYASALFLQIEHDFIAIVAASARSPSGWSRMSTTSSCTPSMVEYSCKTPLILIRSAAKTGHRGQQHPAQCVAEGVTIAALERLHCHLRMEGRDRLNIDDSPASESCFA